MKLGYSYKLRNTDTPYSLNVSEDIVKLIIAHVKSESKKVLSEDKYEECLALLKMLRELTYLVEEEKEDE